MNPITIKPLSSELNKDYLDFFDNRAFTADNLSRVKCYNTNFIMIYWFLIYNIVLIVYKDYIFIFWIKLCKQFYPTK